ncbi:hypothetical protein [Chryseobacterium bernardetii]|uniref:Uncharacterized protein n=1 Tax=Chryseobacterium bernardetii TaxID=1241978 RepID=A0A3G6T328_9FLAO|nr:hypothetical protein [Chryseobacterium bernardetii]AZB23578.1 hypothetical protein EG339_02560 [Chryseobacterium bernardetii]
MEIEGEVLKVKKRYTRIQLKDGTIIDLMYRKSDNYIVYNLKKGDWMRAVVEVKNYKLWRMRVVAYFLHIVKP